MITSLPPCLHNPLKAQRVIMSQWAQTPSWAMFVSDLVSFCLALWWLQQPVPGCCPDNPVVLVRSGLVTETQHSATINCT